MGLSATGLAKAYGDVVAVDDVSVAAAAGDLLVLLGPSGSGKSTLLRLLAGLERADAGRVVIGDADVTDRPPHARGVAMVFQDYALFPHLTVRGNLEFGPMVRRLDAGERQRRIADALEALGLTALADRHPDQLSGGEQQRVALARALVREPAVLLLDEPLASLDVPLRLAAREQIAALHRRLGGTVVYVTHDQAEALTLGTKVAVLRDGRLVQLGTPRDIYDRPADLFVASFVGSAPMNLVAGGGVLGGERRTTVGVRPEDLRMDRSGPLEVTVEAVEDSGADLVLLVRAADGTRLRVRADPRAGPARGSVVRLAHDPQRLHVFDRGGRRR